MSQGPSDGWLKRKVTASSVATLISYRTLWHLRPKDNCEANGIMKTIEKKRKQVQIIESAFKKLLNTIGKMNWTGEGHFGQFTPRDNFLPTCPLKCRKLRLWKID